MVAAVLTLTVLCGIAAPETASASIWTRQVSGTTYVLYGAGFSDADHGWAVGTDGGVRATSDGGSTWGPQSSGVTVYLRDVFFTDSQNGYIVGTNGLILATQNGGVTWGSQSSGTTNSLYDVVFSDATHGWAVGLNGAIRATGNGGASWSAQSSGTTRALEAVFFLDAARGWVVGASGTIRATSNGGASWSAQTSGTTSRLYDVVFIDSAHGWAVGEGGTMLATSNGGATWVAQASGTSARLNAVAFSDPAHGWAVGAAGALIASSDGGVTWASDDSGVAGDLNDVLFTDPDHGWIVGDGGTILTTDMVPPVVGVDAPGTWQSTPVTVVVQATDSGSGVARTQYRLQGTADWTDAVGGVFVVPAPPDGSNDGAHLYECRALDNAGHASLTVPVTVRIDTARPTTSGTPLAPDGATAWSHEAQTVTLEWADSLSGVDATFYAVDGGGWQLYSGPFAVAGEGSHLVAYYSIDVAGNLEETRIGYVNIDSVPPVTSNDGLSADDGSGWRRGPVAVTLAAVDAASGTRAIICSVDGGPAHEYSGPFLIDGPGTHTVVYYATDFAGNSERARTGYVNIVSDLSAVLTVAHGTTTSPGVRWRNEPVTVTLIPQGGVGPWRTFWRVDGDAWRLYSGPFTLEQEGSHWVDYYSIDATGVQGVIDSSYVDIDRRGPDVGTSLVSRRWQRTSAVVQLLATDRLSGVAETRYSVDGLPFTAAGHAIVEARADHGADGRHTVRYYAVDRAGNESEIRNYTVRIDTTRPRLKVAPRRAVEVRNGIAWLRVRVTDNLASRCRLKACVTQFGRLVRPAIVRWRSCRSTSCFSVSLQGLRRQSFSIHVYAIDQAGNRESRSGLCLVRVR
jgi:photosystem II stability/assembly factor-like uncharacterized protein